MNCSETETYLREKARMCEDRSCHGCPLGSVLNPHRIACKLLQDNYPIEAIAIVQKWSDEHPQKTYKDDFFEKFPNAPKEVDGTPKCCCKYIYGYEYKRCIQSPDECYKCWNEVMPE